MRTQHEKNKEILMDEIEKLCNQPMNNSVAERLNTYRGALKAMCMTEKGWEDGPDPVDTRTAEMPAHTPELDGDTDFERVIMSIPTDRAHMVEIARIFADHMKQLAIVNRRAYDNIMLKLREVARG